MALFGNSSFGAATSFGAQTTNSNFGTTPNPMKVSGGEIFENSLHFRGLGLTNQ